MNQEKKSILLITELYPNIDNPFIGTFIVSQLNELRKLYRVVIIVPYLISFSRRISKHQPLRVRGEDDLDVYYIKQYPFWLLIPRIFKLLTSQKFSFLNKKYISSKILRLAKKLHKKYNFSLVHGHESYIGDEAVAVGKKLGIPSIVTIHGLYDYHKLGFGERAMNTVIRNFNLATRLFAVSKVAASSYQQNGVNREIDIIPNGLNENAIKRVNPLPEKWQKIIQEKTVIITVGFFVKEKRFEQVIEAAAKLKEKYNDSFVVLMIGRGGLEGYYKKLIIEKNLGNHIHIVGQIQPNEMMSYYNACDFLVHPSIVESFSMACLEAANAGKPFICTSNIGLTEYITPNNEAFVIPPDDTNILAEKMNILIGDKKLREQMGNSAKKTAETFLWKNQIHKTITTYEQLTRAQ